MRQRTLQYRLIRRTSLKTEKHQFSKTLRENHWDEMINRNKWRAPQNVVSRRIHQVDIAPKSSAIITLAVTKSTAEEVKHSILTEWCNNLVDHLRLLTIPRIILTLLIGR